MRGFLSGVIWGGVVSVLSLGVVSQLMQAPHVTPEPAANLPEAPQAGAPVGAAPAGTAPEATSEVPPEPMAEPVVESASDQGSVPVNPEGATDPEAAGGPDAHAGHLLPEDPQVAADPATPEGGLEATLPKGDAPQPDTPEPAIQGAATPDAVAADSAPLETEAAPELAAPDETSPAPAASAEDMPSAPNAALPDAASSDTASSPEADPIPAEVPADPSAIMPEPEADLAPLPGEVPAHSPLAPEPAADPEPALEPAAPSEPLLDKPAVGFSGAEGVTTNLLPRIEPTPPAPVDPAAEAAAQRDDRPVARYAAPFINPANKPLYAILLLDDGKAQIDRAALAALKVPVTIVIDPATPDAAKLQDLYRAAGKEVAMLASGIPKGAKSSDVQVTFEANAKALPEAVAVVDLPQDGFQNNRLLATEIMPVLKDQGRGLVTFDRGSNAGDQVARREVVPAAVIFRELDAGGETAPLIRRYLDRAAFKAAQDGRVAVMGRASSETIAAVLEWSLEGRAGSVALAPLTAVLSKPE